MHKYLPKKNEVLGGAIREHYSQHVICVLQFAHNWYKPTHLDKLRTITLLFVHDNSTKVHQWREIDTRRKFYKLWVDLFVCWVPVEITAHNDIDASILKEVKNPN